MMKRTRTRLLIVLLALALVAGVPVLAADRLYGEWVEEEYTLPQKMNLHNVVVVDGKIYVLGGTAGSGNFQSVNAFDPLTKAWTPCANLPTAMTNFGCHAYEGKIYVIGGAASQGLDAVHIYDVATNTWSSGASMPIRNYGFASALVEDKIYCIGGMLNHSAVNIYDISNDTWSSGPNNPQETYYATAVGINKVVYVFGGVRNNNTLSSLYLLDIETGKWSRGATMPHGISNSTAQVIDGKIYSFGGSMTSTNTDSVLMYDPDTNTWDELADLKLPIPTSNMASVILDNTVYILGGFTTSGTTRAYTDAIYSLQIGEAPPTPPSSRRLAVLLEVGEDVQLSQTYNLADNLDYTWRSDDAAVATVDANGRVTAAGEGECLIYAEKDGYSESIPIRVVQANADDHRLAVHLTVGGSANLWLADSDQITWTSDATVASVTQTGRVTGVARGLTVVQAELEGEAYHVYVRVA